MGEFFIVGDEMRNINVAVISLDEDILSNLVSAFR
jgi:hypothetical protein